MLTDDRGGQSEFSWGSIRTISQKLFYIWINTKCLKIMHLKHLYLSGANESMKTTSIYYMPITGHADRPLLTHWGRVTHICVGKLTIIGPDNGLSPGRRQAIIWTNAGILLIGPLGTNFIEILIGMQTFSFREMHLKISFAKWRPFCLGLNVLSCVVVWCLNDYPGAGEVTARNVAKWIKLIH